MKNTWMWIVVAVVVIGGGYMLLRNNTAPALSDDGTSAATDAIDDANTASIPAANPGTAIDAGVATSTGTAPMSATITYDGKSFSPASVTVKQGGKVTFTSTAGNMWVASAPHPAHTGYDGTSRSEHCAAGYTGAAPFDQCVAGTTYTFTFNKAGTWPYHNHIQSGAYGSVTVVQ